MAYVALYRKWRPQDFANLIGQNHISTTLKNAITTGKIAHAYLFTGPRGTGKTSTAKILAKALNCEHGPTPTPCNECTNCQKINSGSSMDVFEIDAASNRGIDEIRDLRETVKFAPVDGRYKVYIIDEVHMLTTEAFNALLKTLEEPPPHVVFILATTEPHKIPATIHSRCQRYDFHRIAVSDIEERLKDVADQSGLQVTADALHLIAVHADGGMRDALSVLDQCVAMNEGMVTADEVRSLLGLIGHEWVWRLAESLAQRNIPEVLLTIDELVNIGKDVRQVMLELSQHMRSLMLYKASPELTTIEMYSEDRTILAAQSSQFSHTELVRIIQILHEAANEAKWSPEPRITTEVALIQICRRSDIDVSNLLERVAALEQKMDYSNVPAYTPPVVMERPATMSPRTAAAEMPAKTVKTVIAPEATAPALPPKQEQPVTAEVPVAADSNAKAIWDSVLKGLVANGKRSVHACVSQGHLTAIDDRQAFLQFTASFPKERTEKDDYRAIVEKAINQVTGKNIQLVCRLGSDLPQVRPSQPAVSKAAVAEEDHPAVRQALMMFGGKIIKQE